MIAVPGGMVVDEGKDADAAIGRMGQLLRQQEAQRQSEICAPPGAGGNRVAIASGVCADCAGPPVMRQEAPGAPPAVRPSIAANVTAQVRWREMNRPLTDKVAGKSGKVSGETKYHSTVEIQGRCGVTNQGCQGDCVRMIFESVSAKVVIDVRYLKGHREHAVHEATHARQIRDVVQEGLQRLQTPGGVFTCRKPSAAEHQRELCERRLRELAQKAADDAHAAWKQARNESYARPGGYAADETEQEAFGAGENRAKDIRERPDLTDAQRQAAIDAELTFPAGINLPAEFNPETPPAAAPARRR